MRFTVALMFLAAMFTCVFTSGTVVTGLRLMDTGGISDPQHLAEKFKSALYLQALGGFLAAACLLLMTVHAFAQRAKARGIVTALFTLLAGAIATLAFLDLGAVSDAALSAKTQAPQEPAAVVIPHRGIGVFGRMSLEVFSPSGISHVLAMANVRALTCLCLIGLGAALALAGARGMPPTTSVKPPPL